MTPMPAKVAFDTNILVYATAASADAAHGTDAERAAAVDLNRKRAIARQLVATPSHLSVQLLDEFANVALRKLKLAPASIASLIEGLGFVHRIAPLDQDRTCLALRLVEETGFSFHDCLMLAAALLMDCDAFYTEDMTHGRLLLKRMTILDPFHPDSSTSGHPPR